MTDRPLRVCLVCTGNTCRSPMSEAILKAEVAERGLSWHVDSGGLSTYPGSPASEGSVLAAQRDGFDLRGHRSSAFTPERARSCDLILVHSGEHYHRIATWGDDLADKTYLLKHFPEPGDPGPAAWVEDPIGLDLEDYLDTWRELKNTLGRIVPDIEIWARERSG